MFTQFETILKNSISDELQNVFKCGKDKIKTDGILFVWQKMLPDPKKSFNLYLSDVDFHFNSFRLVQLSKF